MIEAGFEFDGEIQSAMAVIADLPAPLRPVHFSHDEGISNDADRIDDQKRLAAFIARSKSGFFLLGPSVTYSVRLAVGKPLICDCFLDVTPDVAEQFLKHMSRAKPVFGFACAPGERERRNRITMQYGVNTIESWVGRDTQKYIPGFYWLTLIPDALAKQHSISLPVVEAVAHEHIVLEGGQHMFRFYENPEDWLKTAAVTELCTSLPGVFDIEMVKSQLSTARNFLDMNSTLRGWK